MRSIIDPQLQFSEQDIAAIVLDPKSRDDIPQLLRGLQYIYTTPEVRERVFAILAEVLPERADAEGKVSTETGRPGMAQGKILVMGGSRPMFTSPPTSTCCWTPCARRSRRARTCARRRG